RSSLHRSPTRRSSDLQVLATKAHEVHRHLAGPQLYAELLSELQQLGRFGHFVLASELTHEDRSCPCEVELREAEVVRPAAVHQRDRKSTRLNSSHAWI